MMKYCLDVRGTVEFQRDLYKIFTENQPFAVSANVISVKETPVGQLRKEGTVQDDSIVFEKIPIEEVPAEVIEAQKHPENIIREEFDVEEGEVLFQAQKKMGSKILEIGKIWVAEVEIVFGDGFVEDQMKFIHHNGEWKMFIDGN